MAEEKDLLMDDTIVDDPNAIDNIKGFLSEKMGLKLNRKQRRKLAKKNGKKRMNGMVEDIKKLNYIDLIEKLRVLNEKKEKENYEDADEDN